MRNKTRENVHQQLVATEVMPISTHILSRPPFFVVSGGGGVGGDPFLFVVYIENYGVMCDIIYSL